MAHSSQPGCCRPCRARAAATTIATLTKACLDADLDVIAFRWSAIGPAVQVLGVDAVTAAERIAARVVGYRTPPGDGSCDEASVEWGFTAATIVGEYRAAVAPAVPLDVVLDGHTSPNVVPLVEDEHPSPTARVVDFSGVRAL